MVDRQWDVVFRFVLAALAVWRISFMLVREEGPLSVLAGIRLGAQRAGLGRLIGCVKCISLWIAIPFCFFVGGGTLQRIVAWLAISGVCALIDEWTRPPFEWQERPGNELLPTDHRAPE